MRPHQWVKNLLVLAPLAASHRIAEPGLVAAALTAFTAFCLVASGAYVLNDIYDLDSDRAHPRKRERPLASGRLSMPGAIALCIALFAAGALVSMLLPFAFRLILLGYFALTFVYSAALRNVLVIDVIALAALYAVRLVAGGAAVDIPLSSWLVAFAMFLFFSLALVKRYAELLALRADGIEGAAGRGYRAGDAPVVLVMGAASAMVCILVLALYTSGETVRALYGRPEYLWALCPLLAYWIARVWLLAARGKMNEDPVLFAVRDVPSYAVAVLGALVVLAAASA